jgi:hypothetical protein
MSGHLVILQAIALKKRLRASYNGTAMMLAPHILYTRHDEMFVDAVALEKNGAPPREKKLGTFKIIGLKDMELLDQPFDTELLFEPQAEKYAGVTLFAVET